MKLPLLPIMIILLSTSLPSFAADPPAAPTEGLVAYWNLDKVEDGKVRDVSGNGHDGAVVNATFTELGRIDGCL